jgi:solute carrier family 8 (sodium/calcium exchanger)
VRTREDTAKVGRDFDGIDNVITMKQNEEERIIEVKIHDDDEWNPDNDFYVELYDTRTKKRLMGDDTECRVTILDEDFPGKLVFKETEVTGSRKNNKVEVIVNRVEGTDGKISCKIRTEAFIEGKGNELNYQNAVAGTDYNALDETLEFAAGES